jgi:hypothetical protein
MTEPTYLGAWASKCEACGNFSTLPGFPITPYSAAHSKIRPQAFDRQAFVCYCGNTVHVDQDSLDFIFIAELAIRRLSADRFQVERHFAGRKTDLGPMSEANLEAYLKNRGLVDVMPEQVMHHLEDSGEAWIRMAASIESGAAASL